MASGSLPYISNNNFKRPPTVAHGVFNFKNPANKISDILRNKGRSTRIDTQKFPVASGSRLFQAQKKLKRTDTAANDYFRLKSQSNKMWDSPKVKVQSKPLKIRRISVIPSSPIHQKKLKKTKPAVYDYFSFKKYIKTMNTIIKPSMKLSKQTLAILDEVLKNKLKDILETLRDIRKDSKKKTLTIQDLDHVIRLTFPHNITKIATENAKRALFISSAK